MDGSVCTICQHAPNRPLSSNCGHAFCGACICKYIWVEYGARRTALCPVCRNEIKTCSAPPPSGQGHAQYIARLKLGRVEYKVEVLEGRETCLQRLSTLFSLPASRLKLIHKGAILTTEAQVIDAVSHQTSPLLLMASSANEHNSRFMMQLHFFGLLRRIYQPVVQLFAAMLAAVRRSGVWRAISMFFQSMNPSWNNRSIGDGGNNSSNRAHAE